MPADRVYRTEGVVLRQRRLGDADKILVVYTPRAGRIEAVVKGVRRTRSRMAGHVEPLTLTSLLLAKGRNLDIVTQAQAIRPFDRLRNDLDRLSRALYVAELLDRLTGESEENEPLFDLLVQTLDRLDLAPEPDAAVRYFEMQTLDLLGYRPQLEDCVVCGKPLQPVANYYSTLGGGVLCPDCVSAESVAERLSLNALKYMRLLQRAPFADIDRVRLPEALAFEVERHVRGSVRATLEREVRAAQFVDAVRRIGLGSSSKQ